MHGRAAAPPNLSGRVAVITGAAHGIGRSLALRLAASEMKVVAADIDEAALGATVDELRSQGATAIGVTTDVSLADDNEALGRAADELGPPYIVCLNAGVVVGSRQVSGDLLAFTRLDWEWLVDVNLWGAIHGTLAFLHGLVERDEGHIVYTASLASLLPARNPYHVAKQGVHAVAAAVDAYLLSRSSNVGATIVYPGPVATDITASDDRRPERYRLAETDDSDDTADRDELASAAALRGMDPATVAEMVLDAVTTRRFAVLTHPELLPMVRDHYELVLEGLERPPRVVSTQGGEA